MRCNSCKPFPSMRTFVGRVTFWSQCQWWWWAFSFNLSAVNYDLSRWVRQFEGRDIFSRICSLLHQIFVLPKIKYKKFAHVMILRLTVDTWQLNLTAKSWVIRPHFNLHKNMNYSSINNMLLCLPTFICWLGLSHDFVIVAIHASGSRFDIFKESRKHSHRPKTCVELNHGIIIRKTLNSKSFNLHLLL